MDWLDSKNSFDTGVAPHGRDTHHGVLVVSNDDTLAPGTGFDTHPHRDIEIVTWVLEGSLVHQDSTGHNGVIYPGLAQRMTAGTGILHSEKNDTWRLGPTGSPSGDPVHFIQMWVVPDESGLTPGYEQLEIDGGLLAGQWVTIASGMPKDTDTTAIRIGSTHAALRAARLSPGQHVQLPDAPLLHLYVPRGDVEVEGAGRLYTGDALRVTGDGGHRVTAVTDSEVLVWEMDATLR